MTPLGKAAFAGVLNAAGATFVGVTLATIWSDPNWFIIAPLFGVAAVIVASPLVLSLGGALGALMPFVVRNCSSYRAFIRGLLIGILVGFLVTAVMAIRVWFSISGHDTGTIDREALWKDTQKAIIVHSELIVPFCAIWIGFWASRWSKYVA